MPAAFPADARLYLRPVQFVDTPVGRDGEVARLAGQALWFAGWEVVAAAAAGRRLATRTVPVAAFAAFAAALPDAQAERLTLLAARVTADRPAWQLGERALRWNEPRIAGILNMTPDSFSDGGRHLDDLEGSAAAGFAMGSAGAALIDVGGESTRPGAPEVWEGDEVKRVVPVIERLAKGGALVSVDTRKATVMEAALAAGARVVNDVAALLWDERALEVVARAGCPVVLMHSPDPRKGPHGGTGHADALVEVFDWLEARVAAVEAAGVPRALIAVDPGIGFGKKVADSLALVNGLAMFHALGCPVMLGASRKRIIGALSGEAAVGERLGGSVALALKGASLGAQLLRVHDVAETAQALRIWRGLADAATLPPGL